MPPTGTLGKLTEQAWIRSAALPVPRDLDAIARSRSEIPGFARALRCESVGVIAEIKRSSPSKGEINPGLDSGRQAQLYRDGGAAAISVLTEPERFGGSDEDVERVRKAVPVPILRKDFHVSEAQLVHAALSGASAALIIVRAIDPARLASLAAVADLVELELLFEVRDEVELENALEAGAEIIGVNNRNLETLEIDPETVSRIMPLIPAECLGVAESGYSTAEGVQAAAEAGADAVLVGSSLSASADPVAAVRAIARVKRLGR